MRHLRFLIGLSDDGDGEFEAVKPTLGRALPLRQWDWSNPNHVGINLVRASKQQEAKGDGSPYWKQETTARRVIYRAGCFALKNGRVETLLGALRDDRKGSGRHSNDVFAALSRIFCNEQKRIRFSKASLTKHARAMQVARRWNISWTNYGIFVNGIGINRISRLDLDTSKQPGWTLCLTDAVNFGAAVDK